MAENCDFFNPCLFDISTEGFSLELYNGTLAQKIRMMFATWTRKSLMMFRYTTYKCDGQTDGRTPAHGQYRAYA